MGASVVLNVVIGGREYRSILQPDPPLGRTCSLKTVSARLTQEDEAGSK